MNSNLKNGIFYKVHKLNRRDLIIFLIPLIIFSIYLYVYYPGIIMFDSYDQLHQIATGKFTNWHPFFHTFLEMLIIKLYPNTLLVCIFQIVVFSTIWTSICKYNRKDNIKSNLFIVQVILTLIICCIPFNALYSITLWKDVLYSYSLLFLCFLIQILIDKKGDIDYKFLLLLSLAMACVSHLRPNGFYLVIILLIILPIYLFRKNYSNKKYIILPIVTIIFILLIASLNVVYEVEDNQKDALMTKTGHILADYYLNLDIESADKNKIHELLDEDKINENYVLQYSDPIYGIINKNVYDNNKFTYFGLVLKYSIQNPLHFLHYLFGSSVMVWDITRDNNWIGNPYYITSDYDIVAHDMKSYFNWIGEWPVASYENNSFVNYGTSEYNLINSFAIGFKQNSLTDTLFDSPATYMYLSIVLLFLMHMITKSREIYLVYLPNFINILIIFASTYIQDSRYLYANLLVGYLLIIIFLGMIQNKNDKDYYISAQNPVIHEKK